MTGTGVLALSGEWPFLQANAHRWWPERVWESPDAALVLLPRGEGTLLVGVGEAEPLAGLVSSAGLPAGVVHVMLTRGTRARLPAALRADLEPGPDWDWMTLQTPPPSVPGEERARVLTGPAEEILARVRVCLAEGYPERGARPNDHELTWWGHEADGELAAVLAADLPAAPVPGAGVHLSSLAVRPAFRRRGIAAAVMTAATRQGLARTGLVHLGTWTDNDAANRLYERMGFTVAHRVENLRPR